MQEVNLQPTIRVHLSAGQSVEYCLDKILQDMQDSLNEAGVKVHVSRTRSPAIVSAIIVSIVGNVAAHLVIKLADALLERKKKDIFNTNVIVVYRDIEFSLPENHLDLVNLLAQDRKKVLILFLAADPSNATRLRLGEELREIQEKLQLAKLRDRFELHQRMSVRPMDISQALLDVQPMIVHFSGHGATSGALCFEDQSGEILLIEPQILSALFAQFADSIHCIVLNACYSEIQAKAITQYIDYVIGMDKAIEDKAAIAFANGFYQALGAGRNIEEAYKLGCIQIELQGVSGNATPVLLQKSGNIFL